MNPEEGTVAFFDPRKRFGKIDSPSGGDPIFVHISNLNDKSAWTLAAGERVRFVREQTDKGLNALDVERLEERHTGTVEYFGQRGTGYIQTHGGEEPIPVHYSDVATGSAFKRLEEGQEVDFGVVRSADGTRKAVKVVPDMRTPFERFAILPQYENKLEQLVNLAQDEEGDWTYQFQQPRSTFPVLRNYLSYTFKRLQDEEKLAYINDPDPSRDGQRLACFNTGLVTRFYEPLYAAFHENRRDDADTPFVLIGFFTESKHPITAFPKRPDIANYFDNPADLVYDRNLELVKNVHHIVSERLERFPPEFQDDPDKLSGALDIAIARAEQRVLRNYKTAIPQFNHGRIQLLLPICLSDPRKADVALVIGKEGAVYKGYTVLSLDMAYNNARLLTRPDREWLNP